MGQQKRLIKTKTLLDEAQTIMEKLRNHAADDGIIAYDEIDLLKVIDKKMQQYQMLLQDVLRDNNVTKDELSQMRELENELIWAVEDQAIADGGISVPESEIIDKLFDRIKGFSSLDDLEKY